MKIEIKMNGGNKKMKNKILKTINFIVAIIFLLSICLLDSDTWIPCIVCFVCEIWFAIFVFANKETLMKY